MSLRYVSTRGAAPTLGFSDVLLRGLASDGGLYVPERWPEAPLAPDRPYVDLAVEVMTPFLSGEIEAATFADLVSESYTAFGHPEVAPLVELADGLWLMELFHGPTLAFKDVALQLLGRLLQFELERRGERVTIVGATSGDTGSAAIEACRDRPALDVFILHPHGRVSEVQRRQMTTVGSANVHNIAIEGSFDDCQDIVKGMFADESYRSRHRLAAINSINFARVMAQVVYYSAAAARLGGGPISFAVPSGNFGNVFAGYGAMRMGLKVDRLVVGSNRNDVLTRFFHTGRLEIRDVVPTMSPSMDIAVSSNLERLLFEALGRDGQATSALMRELRRKGAAEMPQWAMSRLRAVFSAARVDEEATSRVMAEVYARTGRLIDPHTAVGVGAALECRGDGDVPTVALSTAHPAKFPDAVFAATGRRPVLPERLADLHDRPERLCVLPNDLAAVQRFVADNAGVNA